MQQLSAKKDEMAHQPSEMEQRAAYWETFYASRKVAAPSTPSQFAAFMLSELPDVHHVIEIGSGNGRDAEFFATYGLRVLAMDASAEAVKLCESRRRHRNARYRQYIIGDNIAPLKAHVAGSGEAVALYARFFLHAITSEEEQAFFNLARDILPQGSYIALEYRILEDAEGEKEFGAHFRRFVNHRQVCDDLRQRGFQILYDTQGVGLAKHKTEDAKVGRCIAVRI